MAQSLVEAKAAEAATVTALLHETMPDAQVTRVQRPHRRDQPDACPRGARLVAARAEGVLVVNDLRATVGHCTVGHCTLGHCTLRHGRYSAGP